MKRIQILAALTSMVLITGVAFAQLPNPGLEVDPARTAVVLSDPQNDFLSPEGVTWGLVGKSVEANNTVENIETLMKTAKANGIAVFISPHYYYPTDHGWAFGGAVEKMMHSVGMFDRSGALTVDGCHDVSVLSSEADILVTATWDDAAAYQAWIDHPERNSSSDELNALLTNTIDARSVAALYDVALTGSAEGRNKE